VVVAAIAPAAASSIAIHPYQLSYVNFLVGGVRGAEARGLEVTNLKEVFSQQVISDLSQIIPEDAIVDPGFMTEELCFYQAQAMAPGWTVETQLIRGDGTPGETLTCSDTEDGPVILGRPARKPQYVFVLNRKAIWRPLDRALFLHGGAPAYEVVLDSVPLFRVYRTQ
jgi:hypothetical protein